MHESGIVRIILTATILASTPATITAQLSPQDSIRWLLARGDSLARTDAVGESFRLWKAAAALLQQRGELREAVPILDRIGTTYRNISLPDSALVYFGRNLEIGRSLPDGGIEAHAIYEFGNVYGRTMALRDSGLVYYRRALPMAVAASDTVTIYQTYFGLAYVHGRNNRPDSALVYYGRAIDFAQEIGELGLELEAFRLMASIYNDQLSQPDSAIAVWNRALSATQRVGSRVEEVDILQGIAGQYYTLGRMDLTFAYIDRAEQVAAETGNPTLIESVRFQRGLARATVGLPNNVVDMPVIDSLRIDPLGAELAEDSVLARLRRDLATANWQFRSMILMQLGGHFDSAGQPDSALMYLHRAREFARVQEPAIESLALLIIGEHYRAAQQFDSSAVYFEEGLSLSRTRADLPSEQHFLHALATLRRDGAREDDLNRALAYYDSAAAVTSRIAAFTGSDQAMLSYAEQEKNLFEQWALTSVQMADFIGLPAAARLALAVAERGRAQAMRDQLQRALTGRSGQALDDLTTPGADLGAEAERATGVVTRSGAVALYYLVSSDTLLTWLIHQDGEIDLSTQPLSRDTLTALVEALRARIGADGAGARSRMAAGAAAGLESIEGGQSTGIRSAVDPARRLADLLLPPSLLERLPESGELILLPNGVLNIIPFAVLPLGGDELLGMRYSLRYAPSLAMLRDVVERPSSLPPGARNAGLGRNLVVGNPTMPEVAALSGTRLLLSALPGANAEGVWIAERLGTASLTGAEATEPEVRRRIPEAPLVHLATHAYVYGTPGDIGRSFIALAPAPGADGLLTIDEILSETPTLAAEIVVLSACQTGLGDIKQSEGTVGLQRAFLARGARSVLASLWSVSDTATELLMKRFYTYWLEDTAVTKAEALRRAQQDVRATAGFESPLYWAAFQLSGAQ